MVATGGLDPATRERLKSELAALRDRRRKLAADLVDEEPVGDGGDQAQRLEWADDLAWIDDRITELTELLAGRVPVDPSTPVPRDHLPDGTQVTLRFSNGTEEDLRVVLVPEEASDPERDRVLTVDSPLGRALAGRGVGDTVTYPTPHGEASAKIVTLRPPAISPETT
ncbi:MAG TPA: GreA/GreB family elongation factor [Pseudonocardiaceae bacterium]